MNRKRLSLAFVTTSLLMTASAAILANKNDLLFARASAGESDFTLTLNSTNSPVTSSDTNYSSKTKVINEFVTIEFSSIKYISADALGRIEAGSTITKTTASNNLSRLTVVFDGELWMESSYDGNWTSSSFMRKWLESGTGRTPTGNYWRIVANKSTTITSIVVEYDCDEPIIASSYGTSQSEVTVSGLRGYENCFTNFGTALDGVSDHYYFSLLGVASANYSSKRINPAELVIQGDNGKYPITASYIVYENETNFEACFDMTAWYNDNVESFDGHEDIYAHLFLNNTVVNQSWNNSSYGNLQDASWTYHVKTGEVTGQYGVWEQTIWDGNFVVFFANQRVKYDESKNIFVTVDNSIWCDKSDKVVTKQGSTDCNPKIITSDDSNKTVTFTFWSDAAYSGKEYGIKFSFNNVWSGAHELCTIKLNDGAAQTLSAGYNGTSWETGECWAGTTSGGSIVEGINTITVTGIEHSAIDGQAHAGYFYSLYGIYVNK